MKSPALLLGLLAMASSVRADVIVSTRALLPGKSVALVPETHLFLSENATVQQSWEQWHSYLYQEETLSLPKEKKVFTINLTRNVFREEAMTEGQTDLGEESRIIKIGTEMVLGFKTHHFRWEHVRQGKKLPYWSDVWVAYKEDLGNWPLPACPIKSGDTPYVTFRNRIASGLVVRNELWDGGMYADKRVKKIATIEVTSITHCSIDPSFYRLPNGAQRLTRKEYFQDLATWTSKLEEKMGMHPAP